MRMTHRNLSAQSVTKDTDQKEPNTDHTVGVGAGTQEAVSPLGGATTSPHTHVSPSQKPPEFQCPERSRSCMDRMKPLAIVDQLSPYPLT